MIGAENKTARKQRKVPDYLVYEIMDGKPIYYKGYQSVLNKRKKPEDIMGSSLLQAVIVNFLLTVLHKYLNEDDYWVMTNEVGIHLNLKNNLAGDIVLFEKSKLRASDISNEYGKVPAKLIVEVDTKADLNIMVFEQYMKSKTTKFHDFGVDKIIWILTASKQVVIAQPNQDWLLIDWNKDIEIINGITFNIGSYLAKNGIELKEEE